jgi:formate hydrogenlyase subunit 6/NADH:ubiquinone oxidoreductase subunit I
MKILRADNLNELASGLAKAGYRVIAPQRVGQSGQDGDGVRLMEWTGRGTAELGQMPANSAKDFIFVPSEVIGRYKLNGDEFALGEVAAGPMPKTVLLGIRPCEAAALAAMDAVFNWDSKDEFYNARRANTIVVAAACTTADENCFCTSVGGGPDSEQGADVMVRSADQGKKFIVEPLTDKGGEMVAAAGGAIGDGEAVADQVAAVPVRFDARRVSDWVAKNFDSPRWQEWSLACLGCAACAYACPTCHCFDIQDEGTRSGGVRYRNWDACGLALFTLHTSGHNPRPDQASRWRQRVLHKFSYFVEKFGRLACTGCGRCARLCPAGLAIAETCQAIAADSAK